MQEYRSCFFFLWLCEMCEMCSLAMDLDLAVENMDVDMDMGEREHRSSFFYFHEVN